MTPPIPTDLPREQVLRVATYNIHKGVQGMGPMSRLEFHNLLQAFRQLDADVVCLQEVRKLNRQWERKFNDWPRQSQADFLADTHYQAVYVTNATTKHGEHGNALLTRGEVARHQHEDMSDHRFEQRGLLHSEITMRGQRIHVIVVHLGLIAASRVRQIQQLIQFVLREIPEEEPLVIAGDFNDWGKRLTRFMDQAGLLCEHGLPAYRTYPSTLPLTQLDFIYYRGLQMLRQFVPQKTTLESSTGIRSWARLSDHLPLVADFVLE